MKAAKGHVFKYGDNVDTDVIIPARYLNSSCLLYTSGSRSARYLCIDFTVYRTCSGNSVPQTQSYYREEQRGIRSYDIATGSRL